MNITHRPAAANEKDRFVLVKVWKGDEGDPYLMQDKDGNVREVKQAILSRDYVQDYLENEDAYDAGF